MTLFLNSIRQSSARSQWLLPAIGFLVVAYLAGIWGLSWPVTQPYFKLATPVNLLVSAALLLRFHTQWNRSFYQFLIAAYLLGFFIEVIGVRTDVIFGTYWYGPTLGPKILDVPLVIGVNWLMLTYAMGCISNFVPVSRIIKSLIAAFLMVGLDFLIEPVAMKLDFWQWSGGQVPFRNYLGWMAVAWVMQLLFFFLPFAKRNPLAPYLIAIQILFFLILNVILV